MEEGRFSGQHKRILAVAQRLRQEGIETLVYFPQMDSEYFEARLREAGVEYRRMNINRPTKDPRLFARYLVSFLPEIVACFRQLRRDRVTLVHCNGSWQVKGALAAKLAGKKVVWHLNDTKRPFVIKLIFSLMAALLADTLIVAGNRVKSYYLENGILRRRMCEVIQAPVDTKMYDPAVVTSDGVLAPYKGINIVTISNVNPVKGLEHFIDMARILSERYESLDFHIVGSIYERQRNYYRNLQNRIREYGLGNVWFHGFAANIENYLKEADIFVCSSLYEASPTSVWEAMSMGKAIVSTDVGDVAAMIQDGLSGFVVQPGSGKALGEKVRLLIEDPWLRSQFGIRAREEALKKLDVDACVISHSRVYRMTAGNPDFGETFASAAGLGNSGGASGQSCS